MKTPLWVFPTNFQAFRATPALGQRGCLRVPYPISSGAYANKTSGKRDGVIPGFSSFCPFCPPALLRWHALPGHVELVYIRKLTFTLTRGKRLNNNGRKTFEVKRRQMLGCMCALGAGIPLLDVRAQDASAMAPPQPGDLLGHAFGAKAGQAIAVDELTIDAQQVFAFAIDPQSGGLRNGTRMNQVVLVRLDPATLSADTAARSVNGVVAYSGVCSHTGCDVTDWNGTEKRFQCPCHESQFDPRDGARVVGGPAPWQLAALPLAEKDGKLAVAGEFQGRLGFMQPGLDPFGL